MSLFGFADFSHKFAPGCGQNYGKLYESGTKVFAGHHMGVEMKDYLSTTLVNINEKPVSGVRHPKIGCDYLCNLSYVAQQRVSLWYVI
jgi:hypothetical protein